MYFYKISHGAVSCKKRKYYLKTVYIGIPLFPSS